MAKKQFKHQEHILAVPSNLFGDRQHGFSAYQLKASDIIIAQRKFLEKNDSFRQILPMSMFIHNNKVWAYERTEDGGEIELHNKVAVFAGGHWDINDIVLHDEEDMEGMINLQESLKVAVARELDEEVIIKSKILNTRCLPYVIAADDVFVDRHHYAIIFVHELDGEEVFSNESALKDIGFVDPQTLLSNKNLETWARLACKIVSGYSPEFHIEK